MTEDKEGRYLDDLADKVHNDWACDVYSSNVLRSALLTAIQDIRDSL